MIEKGKPSPVVKFMAAVTEGVLLGSVCILIWGAAIKVVVSFLEWLWL